MRRSTEPSHLVNIPWLSQCKLQVYFRYSKDVHYISKVLNVTGVSYLVKPMKQFFVLLSLFLMKKKDHFLHSLLFLDFMY